MPGPAINEDRIKQIFMNLDGRSTPLTTSHVKRKNMIQNRYNKSYRKLVWMNKMDSDIDAVEEDRGDV